MTDFTYDDSLHVLVKSFQITDFKHCILIQASPNTVTGLSNSKEILDAENNVRHRNKEKIVYSYIRLFKSEGANSHSLFDNQRIIRREVRTSGAQMGSQF